MHLKLIFRSFFRNLPYSLVTLTGLVVGLTAAILIFIWVKYELTYDRYHADNERVYGVMMNENIEGEIETSEETPVPLMDFLSTSVPGVEAVTRFDNTRAILNHGERSIQRYGAYADSGYFQVFSPVIVAGNSEMPLPGNHSIAVSRELAGLLFENGDALGKTIQLDLKSEYKVTAIFDMFPQNSSLRGYHFILPYHAKVHSEEEWENYYVKLHSTDDKTSVEQKINKKFAAFFEHDKATSLLFPLTDWRLHWSFENGKVSGGRIVYVIIFGVTAIFILVMACVNYVNIATARAAKRGREVGVRKMTGASQSILIRQFMMESLVLTFIATAASLLLAWMVLPLFNNLTGTPLQLDITDPLLPGGLAAIALFAGVVAGSYPAFLLSSLRPALVLKGNLNHALTGAGLRKTLVVFQFTLSIILIFSAVVLRQQTNHMLQKDLGFDKNNVINVWLDPSQNLPLEQLRTEIANHSSIVAAGLGGASPMEVNGSAEANWPDKKDNTPLLLNGVTAHYDMLPTLKLDIVEGRNFSRDHNDSASFIITQHAAELMGFTNPVGQTIRYNMFGDQQGTIIGVVKDFQNDDIHIEANPVIFIFDQKEYLFNLFIRYEDGKLDEAVAHVKAVFNKFQPGIPVEYSFLDSDFENQFYQEKLLNNLSLWFTTIAVVIACLGLFGLTMFNTERRTKEIGIRKVLGASVSQVVRLLLKDFFKPVMLSFVIAFPPAYYLMEEFLEGYVFRIDMPVLSFVMVGVVMIVLVLMTTGWLSVKAAGRNPVESLKSE